MVFFLLVIEMPFTGKEKVFKPKTEFRVVSTHAYD